MLDRSEHGHRVEPGATSQEISSFGQSLPPLRLVPNWKVHEVKTLEQLERVCQRLKRAPILSVDTETGGIGDEAINRRLALIQIGIPKVDAKGNYAGRGTTYLIDVVALEQQADDLMRISGDHVNPLSSLKSILQNESQLKIVQAGHFEEGQFSKYDVKLIGTDDTKKMAQELRPALRARGSQAGFGLGSLAVELIGNTLDKGEQDSKWLVRPLSDAQLNYAALDPEVTYEVWRALKAVQDAVAISTGLETSQLVYQYEQEIMAHQAMIRPIASQIFVLEDKNQQRIERIKSILTREAEALRIPLDSLTDEELPVFEDDVLGSARVRFREERGEDIQKLFELDPKVAKEVVYETATRKDVEAAFVQKGVTPADARKICDRLYEKVGTTEPSLKLEIDLSRLYREASGLEVMKDNWKSSGGTLDQFLSRMQSSPILSLSCPSQGKEKKIVIGLPRVQQGKVTKGAGLIFEISEEQLSQLAETQPEQLQILRSVLSDSERSVVTFEQNKALLWIEEFGLEVSCLQSLVTEAERFRPDLPAYTEDIITAEVLGVVPGSLNDTLRAKSAVEVALEIRRRKLLSAIEDKDERDPWKVQIEREFRAILEARAEKMALLRSVGETYDISRVRASKILERLTENLLAKKERDDQTKVREEGEWGVVSISQRAVNELNIRALRAEFPEIADAVLKEKINKALLEVLWKKETQPQIFEKNWDKVFPPNRVGLSSSAAPNYGAIHQPHSTQDSIRARRAA